MKLLSGILYFTCVNFALAGFHTGAAFANEKGASGSHTIHVNPSLKKKLSQETLDSITKFFEKAEQAISTSNLEALMSLYSDSYRNGDHDKAAAEEIWKRIFDTFTGMSTMHNMRLVSYDEKSNVIIIGCSGLLLGTPKGQEDRKPVDTWTNEEHILTMEDGKWKLLGTIGNKRSRLWFDKPMHPLF